MNKLTNYQWSLLTQPGIQGYLPACMKPLTTSYLSSVWEDLPPDISSWDQSFHGFNWLPTLLLQMGWVQQCWSGTQVGPTTYPRTNQLLESLKCELWREGETHPWILAHSILFHPDQLKIHLSRSWWWMDERHVVWNNMDQNEESPSHFKKYAKVKEKGPFWH